MLVTLTVTCKNPDEELVSFVTNSIFELLRYKRLYRVKRLPNHIVECTLDEDLSDEIMANMSTRLAECPGPVELTYDDQTKILTVRSRNERGINYDNPLRELSHAGETMTRIIEMLWYEGFRSDRNTYVEIVYSIEVDEDQLTVIDRIVERFENYLDQVTVRKD